MQKPSIHGWWGRYGSKKISLATSLIIILVGFIAFEGMGLLSDSLRVTSSGSINYLPGAPKNGTWAIIGPDDKIPAMHNIFWLFGNQSISYVHMHQYDVTNFEDVKDYAGLVIWTISNQVYNYTAIKLFAKTKPVISDIYDFSSYFYPTLKNSRRTVSISTVEYVTDWGNFQEEDKPEMHNGTNYLTTIIASDLSRYANTTAIAVYNSTRVALFSMKGVSSDSGFYVMDLRATRPNSYEAGNYHIFPAIAKAATIKVGLFSRWMTDRLSFHSLTWIYSWMTNFTDANSDVVSIKVIGNSVQGKPIKALFIGKGTRYFIADAAIHGNEKLASHSLLRFAELLVGWYHSDSSWQQKLNQYKVILVPVLNPDGYEANTRDNAHGKDLNRQFPPDATTTEPEAWALRWLMGNYTPTLYSSFHSGGDVYPMNVFYPGLSVDPYRSYNQWAINEGNLQYQDLDHWGTVYDTIWVGKYYRISSSGYYSMSNEYAYYKYKAASILAEHWGSVKAQLQGQEFFITLMLALLLHNDKPSNFIIHTNTFLTQATYSITTGLKLYVNATYIAGNNTSQTKIRDFNNLGKPLHVFIDGTQKTEGNGWSWNDSIDTVTVTGATKSITLNWNA